MSDAVETFAGTLLMPAGSDGRGPILARFTAPAMAARAAEALNAAGKDTPDARRARHLTRALETVAQWARMNVPRDRIAAFAEAALKLEARS